jgi:hypothetical protein
MTNLITSKTRIDQKKLDRILSHAAFNKPLKSDALSESERIYALREIAMSGKLKTTEPFLPLILSLNGSPYTLHDHFHFSPTFATDLPPRSCSVTARQLGKTVSEGAGCVVRTASISYFSTFVISPMYEQVRNISNNVIRPFIDRSPLKKLWQSTTTEKSVLQRSFKNNSKMMFSFALLDVDRVRGKSADFVWLDEIQDMRKEHVPIILETMSRSKYRILRQTGTPKTFDSYAHSVWDDSSQAEWFIPCSGCLKWNIPSTEFDLIKMLGPVRKDIGYGNSGLVCAQCGKPLNSRSGRWVHRLEHRKFSYPGRHISQPIVPFHNESRRNWADIKAKQSGRMNTTPATFFNEVLGESYDIGAKLVTKDELRRASCLPIDNDPSDPRKVYRQVEDYLRGYRDLALGVDWGGGGISGTSLTKVAIAGLRSDNKIDVIFGAAFVNPQEHIREALQIKLLMNLFGIKVMCHDYSGAGHVRESILTQTGVLDVSQTMPMEYVRAKATIYYVPAGPTHQRDHWRIDKPQTLLYTCNAIRLGLIRFFRFDWASDDDPGLICDFLSLVEDRANTQSVGNIFLINCAHGKSDDFAQATNLATIGLWHRNNAWPDFNIAIANQLSDDAISAAGDYKIGWTDQDIEDNFLGTVGV